MVFKDVGSVITLSLSSLTFADLEAQSVTLARAVTITGVIGQNDHLKYFYSITVNYTFLYIKTYVKYQGIH